MQFKMTEKVQIYLVLLVFTTRVYSSQQHSLSEEFSTTYPTKTISSSIKGTENAGSEISTQLPLEVSSFSSVSKPTHATPSVPNLSTDPTTISEEISLNSAAENITATNEEHEITSTISSSEDATEISTSTLNDESSSTNVDNVEQDVSESTIGPKVTSPKINNVDETTTHLNDNQASSWPPSSTTTVESSTIVPTTEESATVDDIPTYSSPSKGILTRNVNEAPGKASRIPSQTTEFETTFPTQPTNDLITTTISSIEHGNTTEAVHSSTAIPVSDSPHAPNATSLPPSVNSTDSSNSVHQFFVDLQAHTVMCLFAIFLILLFFATVFFFCVAIILGIKQLCLLIVAVCKRIKRCFSRPKCSGSSDGGFHDAGSLFPRCDVDIRPYNPNDREMY